MNNATIRDLIENLNKRIFCLKLSKHQLLHLCTMSDEIKSKLCQLDTDLQIAEKQYQDLLPRL